VTEQHTATSPAPDARRPADAVLAAAVDLARAAAVEVGAGTVGDHCGLQADGDRVVTHAFVSLQPGYRGWFWAVTLNRAPRSRVATVAEVVLLPGPDALLAPPWVPWEERVRPGDLGPGDLLPTAPDDPRLVPAYLEGDDRYLESLAWEVGLGRRHVLSREGRLDAAERWATGDSGPDTPMARQAPGRCGTCGYLVSLAGSLAAGFGVCGNEVTATDGRVVSVEFGCGAHSEVRVDGPSPAEPLGEIVYDDGQVVPV
jgi:hypothetical protein